MLTAECICSESAAHLIQNISRVTIDYRSVWTPTSGHPLTDETFRDANERHATSGSNVASGGIVSDEQFRSGDVSRKGRKRAIVSPNTRLDRVVDSLALFGGTALVDEYGCA
jgi:hypothetical protein